MGTGSLSPRISLRKSFSVGVLSWLTLGRGLAQQEEIAKA